MSSGLDWDEAYYDPFSITTRAYFDEHFREKMLQLKITSEPGKSFKYLSGNTFLLGFVNIRNSNSLLPSKLSPETQITADGSYIVRMPYVKARLTGYVTKFENATEKSYFFTQSRLGDESTGFLKIGRAHV